MRNWITAILLVPMCLFTMIGGILTPVQNNVEHTEETVFVTEETVDETEDTVIIETVDVETEPAVKETEPIVEETKPSPTAKEESSNKKEGKKSLGTFVLTAYCGCKKCCGKYAKNRPVDENGKEIVYGSIGVRLEEGVSIAVDPKVIPYKKKVVINGHTYIAHDTGVKGKRIDVYFENHQDALNFGRRKAKVYIYG